jgi:hypothetical protein
MRRNWITGPGYRSLDATLVKSFGLPNSRFLGEGAKLEFHVDAFNLFNNLNLTSGINGDMHSPNFGVANGALSGRVVTLGARFDF